MRNRFSQEERQTIWDMREAGVPVKRIAKHLGRQNVSLRKSIADAGGKRPTARQRSELRLSREKRGVDLEGPGGGRLPVRAIAEALGRCPIDGVPGGQRQRRQEEVSGPRRRPGGLSECSAAQAGQAGGVPPASGGRRAQARGQVGHPANLGVVGSGVPRSPGDTGRVPRDHSTSHSSCRAAERCAKSSIRACAAVEP